MALNIDSQMVAGIPTVYLQGDFDLDSAPRVRTLLESLTCRDSPAIRFHLGRLDCLDSVGLGVLVAGLKQARDRNGSLSLIAPPPIVERTLRITGLDKLFPIVTEDRPMSPADEQAALAGQ
ncbi:MAG: STAS domain-containing protein [Armatimonadota bacterium]|nr:STAS domain-containing protein [Armatimonadota bacterium]